jgi:hypothetical protein
MGIRTLLQYQTARADISRVMISESPQMKAPVHPNHGN